MKAKDAVGKRIVEIKQKRRHWEGGNYAFHEVTHIVLEDGTTLKPYGWEMGHCEFPVSILVEKPQPGGELR